MKRLKDISFQQKLLGMIVLVTAFSLVVTVSSFMAYEFITFRHRALSTISGLAQVVRLNSQAALSAGDTTAVSHSIAVLGGVPEVQRASIFKNADHIFATFQRAKSLADMPDVQFRKNGHVFHNGVADYFEPIVANGQSLGTLFIRYDLGETYSRIQNYGWISLTVVLAGFPLLLLLSNLLNRNLCRPIVELAAVSHQVSEAQDYSVRVGKYGDDEIGSLIDGFNHMLAEVEKREADLVSMLENLEEGVLSIDTAGRILGIHSGRMQELYHCDLDTVQTIAELFAADDKQMALFKRWLKLATQPRFLKNWKSHEKLNPFLELHREVQGKMQILSTAWRPVVVDGQLKQVMVLSKDITEQRRSREVLAETRREQEALLERVMAFIGNEKAEVKEFLDSAYELVKAVSSMTSVADVNKDLLEIKRDLHTLKGNAGTVGFNKLSTIAGELEDVLEADKNKNPAGRFAAWQVKIAVFQTELQRIVQLQKKLFPDGDDRMYIDRQRYDQLLDNLRSGDLMVQDDIYKTVRSLDSQPFGHYCRKYQRLLANYRSRFQKTINDLVVETPETLAHRDTMRLLEPSIIHLVRNALDHGLESDAKRRSRGKGPGTIRIGFHQSEDLLRISITDDGQGIDSEKMVQIALARNLITAEEAAKLNRREKVDLILLPGFTTREKVNSISGRGIGMNAVTAYMEKIGGSLEIFTRIDKGTRMTLRLPLSNGHLMLAARSGLHDVADVDAATIGEWAEQESVPFAAEAIGSNAK